MKKQEDLTECCNAPKYKDGPGGWYCSQCDGNGRTANDDEGCGEERCDGTCDVCYGEADDCDATEADIY